jgi:proline iminopeptidase
LPKRLPHRCHYFVHHGFLRRDDQLLRGASNSAHPATIVQGRYDVVCPALGVGPAPCLARARFTLVPDAGHSMAEPGIRSALIRETARMARVLRRK